MRAAWLQDPPKDPGGYKMFSRFKGLFPSLAEAERYLEIDRDRVMEWVYDPPSLPRDDTLRRFSTGLARRIAERNRERDIADPAPTPDEMRAQIMRDYGWELTYEEKIGRDRPRCPMCGEVQKRGEVCVACNPLQRILNDPLREELGRYVFTLMALARGLSPDRIAPLLKASTATVEVVKLVKAWEAQLRPTDLVETIRAKMAVGLSLFRATAEVLDVSPNLLTRLLHGVYKPKGKRKRVALIFTRRLDLAARLDLEVDEYQRMAGVSEADRVEKQDEWMRRARLERDRRRGILPSGPGRPPSECGLLIRRVHSYRLRGEEYKEIVDHPEFEGLLKSELRDKRLKHARRCSKPECLRIMVMDLSRAEGKNLADIVRLTGKSESTIRRILDREEHDHPTHFRWTIGQIAEHEKVSTQTIRRRVVRGEISVTRSPGGYRLVSRQEIPPKRLTENALCKP